MSLQYCVCAIVVFGVQMLFYENKCVSLYVQQWQSFMTLSPKVLFRSVHFSTDGNFMQSREPFILILQNLPYIAVGAILFIFQV